jgi:hypothetical protein
MNLTVKNVKITELTEFHEFPYGLKADLYLDDKKIAFVADLGDGGEFRYNVFDKANFQKVVEYANTLKYTSEYFEGEEMTLGIDGLVNDLCMKIEKEKKHKKMLKKTENGFMFLSSDGMKYEGYSYKHPLKVIVKMLGIGKVQTELDKIRKEFPKYTLINENLAQLGLK